MNVIIKFNLDKMIDLRLQLARLFVFIVLATIALDARSQSGFYLYTGPSTGFTGDKIYSEGGANFGYVVGFDVRTNDDAMHFLLSAERGANDIIPNTKFGFIGGKDFSYNKFKVGLGWDVKKIGRSAGMRTKFQANFMSVASFDSEALPGDKTLSQNGYNNLNDGLIGLSTGLSYFKKKLFFGLEYELGLYNLIKDKKDTKMNFINIVIGYKLF
jgi:hypothetical protein